jgi:predicted phosphodiesterase
VARPRIRGGPERLRVVRDLVLQLVLATVVAAVVAAPLAVAWTVTRTQVQQTVGVTPTSFSLTTAGHSELRLGVAGTLYLPRSKGPLGVVATVQGPTAQDVGGGDLASYVTPDMLQLYTGLFHDPEPALKEYVDVLSRALWHGLLSAELLLAAGGGLTLFALRLVFLGRAVGAAPGPALLREGSRGRRARAGAALGVALVASSTLAVVAMWPADSRAEGVPGGGVYDLPSLAGTPAAGTTTNSPVVRLLLGGAVPKVQAMIRRQDDDVRSYRELAQAGLRRQAGAMAGPRDGERAVIVQSDMHCNTTMITLQKKVDAMLRERYGDDVPALMAIAGDLTTNGTAAEGQCIKNEAAIAHGAPVVAVTGNHESETSVKQMEKASMTVLSGKTTTVAGLSALGAGDPERSELFGATHLRGDDTEADVGERLYDTARADRPDLLVVHEAYAAQAFLGVSDMTAFLRARGAPTVRYEDGVRDVPASVVLYGHWHRSIAPRVVWNTDGTWTLVMELDTSGGAIDTPTIGHFSTPWSSPEQEASFPVLFLDKTSGLVTGYQIFRFAVDGAVTVQPRVDVGEPPG